MKLTICDKCGRVIENYKEGHNKATINYSDYSLCDSCINDILSNMKFPNKDNEKQIIQKVSDYGFYDIKKIKELTTDGTNRDKINKMSNEELSSALTSYFYQMSDCSCGEWEAKETQKEDKNKTIFIQLPKDETTSKAIETLLLELHKMSARLDKLEKCNRIAEVKEHIEERLKEETKDLIKNMRPATQKDVEEFVDKIGRCAEEVRQMNKTADQMFEELNYSKGETNSEWVGYC